MNLGIVQAALNKTQLAEISYKKALANRRKYPDCYYNLGNLVRPLDTVEPLFEFTFYDAILMKFQIVRA